jgi:predicted dehydrogenase
MAKEEDKTLKNDDSKDPVKFKPAKIGRRDLLKGLATVPVLGAFAYTLYRKRKYDRFLKNQMLENLNVDIELKPEIPVDPKGKTIRLGLIGYGIRGKALCQALGFLHPDMIRAAQETPEDGRYVNFMAQENLNVVINGVCDIFDSYGEMARVTAGNVDRKSSVLDLGNLPKRYRNYKELLAADDIDAVIIATPDHWHARMTIDASNAGKHIYCEKPMTKTVEETNEVYEVLSRNNTIFQLGHNNRQSQSYLVAREMIRKNILGKISLIEVTTNRNDPNGAWVYPIHPEANPQTIDWQQFIGYAPWHDFSLERFFRWRCWWDYSTGLSGDLLTHEYDAMNQILGLGIPHSAMSSGGIYFFKDGRTVPDVLTTVFEYPDRDLTLMYSATLASSKKRGKLIMGHDATMELGNDMKIYADRASEIFKNKIDSGIIDPLIPIYSFVPGRESVDAITSATQQYFADRGLLYTYRNGKRYDVSHLHLKEWLEAIRNGTPTSCGKNPAYEEAIAAHMGTTSYLEKRQVFWDPDNRKIV